MSKLLKTIIDSTKKVKQEMRKDFASLEDLEESKRPLSKSKHLGIEIEALSPYTRSYITAQLITQGLHKYCSIVTDGSLRLDENKDNLYDSGNLYPDGAVDILCDMEDDYDSNTIATYLYLHKIVAPPKKSKYGQAAFEIRVLTTEYSLPLVMRKLGKFFKSIDATVNQSCGLHVHLDMRNRDVKECYKRLVSSRSLLESKVHQSRIHNSFSRRNEFTDFDAQVRMDERYRAINPMAYRRHQTLEVRLHEGCVDVKKITEWCQLLVAIADNKGVKSAAIRKTKTA